MHTHRLELSVTGEPAVLDRVVSVCRSRRCTIVSLHFEAPDRHRPGRLSLGFSADARRAQLATEHLSGLVDVLAVAAIRDLMAPCSASPSASSSLRLP